MAKKWYNLFVSVDSQTEDGAQILPSGAASPQPPRAAQAGPTTTSRAPAAAPAAARNAAQTVAEIAASLGAEPKLTPAGSEISFDEIYKLAEIRPPSHGYTIAKIAEMLQSEHLRGLPPAVKRASVLTALEAASVNIEDVIQDAIKRDRALDAYERAQQKAVETLEAAKTKQNQETQAELDRMVAEYQSRMRANSDAVAKEKERFFGWRLKKQQEEQKIADAVGYFLTENPITTTSTGSEAQPQQQSAKNAEKEDEA